MKGIFYVAFRSSLLPLPPPPIGVKSGTISQNIKNIIKVIAYLHIFYIEFENSTFNGQLL